MGTGVFRHRGHDRQAATYWRRRFIALVIGLAVLALIAWALSGALRSSLAVRSAASHGRSRDGHAARQAGHGAGGPRPAAAPVSPGGSPARPPATAAGIAGGHSPAASHSPAARPKPAPAPSVPRRPPPVTGHQAGTCRPASVVLSLSSSQASFGPRQMPVFDLDVVSTSARTCTFNIGAKYLVLEIKSGHTRIWDSGDCVAGHGSLVTDLERGVPTTLPVTWDRQTSSPGCQAASQHVPAGHYVATAVAGPDASNTEAFRLR